MKVLIVDDSAVFRGHLRAVIEELPTVKEIDSAATASHALHKLMLTDYDLMALDLDMPDMDGVQLLEQLPKNTRKPQVIVLSTFSPAGAEKTIAALQLGASAFSNKPGAALNCADVKNMIRLDLIPKILSVSTERRTESVPRVARSQPKEAPSPTLQRRADSYQEASLDWDSFTPKAIVIGASTGGPAALKAIFNRIRPPLSMPILITQHMPTGFTQLLAESLHALTGLEVCEAAHWEELRPNRIYIAPGDFHMSLKIYNGRPVIALNQAEKMHSVRPAVDPLFASAAKIFGADLLGILLTGMGQDGCDGCQAIKAQKGRVIIQDEASSAVWGMPGAVFRQGAFDSVLSLEGIESLLHRKIALSRSEGHLIN